MSFQLHCPYTPGGDQPQAIAGLVRGLRRGKPYQILKGVTGSGKTFTMANVIAETQRPALIVTHNKVLAKQLYDEFREFFPGNAVCHFVSSYVDYVPESYRYETDRLVKKFAITDNELTQERVDTLNSLLNRSDVIVVASVSCLYGLGSQDAFQRTLTPLNVGQPIDRVALLSRLANLRYKEARKRPWPGAYFVDGDALIIVPSFTRIGWRLIFAEGTIVELATVDIDTGEAIAIDSVSVHPAFESVMPLDELPAAIERIKREARNRIAQLRRQGNHSAAQRLAARIHGDIKRMQTEGSCPGMEDYGKLFSSGPPGTPTETLLSHLPANVLTFLDESHRTLPLMHAMHLSDIKRKQSLVDHGFLLPSALDRRPLTLREFEDHVSEIIYVSATPGPYELARAGGAVVEQQIRPKGQLDPEIDIEPSCLAVDHLTREISQRAQRDERTLVMAVTKSAAEEFADQLQSRGIRCAWMHSDLTPPERNQLLADLRERTFDALVGCNLLREGLDLPQVSLVAILSADREGFLRDETSFIQMIGRAARHENGKAILYADTVTPAMARAIHMTRHRRRLQAEFKRQQTMQSTVTHRSA